ncbi:MAG: hypothetical protein RI898_101, partial [Actinomycetota bacterium]
YMVARGALEWGPIMRSAKLDPQSSTGVQASGTVRVVGREGRAA